MPFNITHTSVSYRSVNQGSVKRTNKSIAAGLLHKATTTILPLVRVAFNAASQVESNPAQSKATSIPLPENRNYQSPYSAQISRTSPSVNPLHSLTKSCSKGLKTTFAPHCLAMALLAVDGSETATNLIPCALRTLFDLFRQVSKGRKDSEMKQQTE